MSRSPRKSVCYGSEADPLAATVRLGSVADIILRTDRPLVTLPKARALDNVKRKSMILLRIIVMHRTHVWLRRMKTGVP